MPLPAVFFHMFSEPVIIGKYIYRVNEISSTNAEMLEHPEKYQHGAVLVATRQIAGRGRAGREWNSDDGGLYMSMFFSKVRSPSDFLPFVLLSALAVTRIFKLYTKEKTEIKWPNDVYINGKKICGILAESSVRGSTIHLVIGIGINITNTVKYLGNLRHPAIALKDLVKDPPSPDRFLNELLVELNALYNDFQKGAFSDHLNELDKLLYSRGKPMQLHTNGMIREITPLGFHSDASLVCLEKGKKTHVFLGEF